MPCQLSYGGLGTYVLERLPRIELGSLVWKTSALPLSYNRKRQSHHPVELTMLPINARLSQLRSEPSGLRAVSEEYSLALLNRLE